MASVFNPYRVTFGFNFSTCSLKLLSSHVKPKRPRSLQFSMRFTHPKSTQPL
ncbi:hypothetical protein ISN44_As13g007950 [Arabidopsis suecica]|uniref:Uncharacterized protein n=1 Tax=Arabidopsis suecica TaxID=45249 RepID=A0A8T1Y0I9_ARASU|nr:hypothetical protein ISN44_As13g007950 [Arabidopsis suecica]KAG7536874.1 hypothetical protein ISN44_As13g007950 [Arabidopsis suecica]